jgi:hypothetical protein
MEELKENSLTIRDMDVNELECINAGFFKISSINWLKLMGYEDPTRFDNLMA